MDVTESTPMLTGKADNVAPGPIAKSKWMRKLGFTRRYSYRLCKLFLIVVGRIIVACSILAKGLTLWGLALLFSFARLPLLHTPTFERQTPPGEWYWFGKPGVLKCTYDSLTTD